MVGVGRASLCWASNFAGLLSPGHWEGGADGRQWRDNFCPQGLPGLVPRALGGSPCSAGPAVPTREAWRERAGSSGVASAYAQASEPVSRGSSHPARGVQLLEGSDYFLDTKS